MSKTLVCTNVLSTIRSEIYGNHCQEWFRLGRRSSDEFILFHPNRMSIDSARNQAARFALEHECDYLWFLDDDMILSNHTYESLKKCNADVVMAHSIIRGEPFDPMFFIWGENELFGKALKPYRDWEKEVDENGILKVDAVGFACALLKVSRLREMMPPYFVTGSGSTEDIYYCIKLREMDEFATILVDCRVPTGHLLNPEAVSFHNVKQIREFYKKDTELREERSKDRGRDYLEQCKLVLNKS